MNRNTRWYFSHGVYNYSTDHALHSKLLYRRVYDGVTHYLAEIYPTEFTTSVPIVSFADEAQAPIPTDGVTHYLTAYIKERNYNKYPPHLSIFCLRVLKLHKRTLKSWNCNVSLFWRLYEKSHLSNPVTFGTWMAFGLPLSVLVLLVCWCWLQVAFLRCR